MTLRFYLDHNVRAAVASGLRRRGIDVLTAAEDGRDRCDDEGLLRLAAEPDRVFFTHDDDFLAIAARWRSAGQAFPGVVYAHQMKITTGQAIADLDLLARAVEPTEIAGEVQFLPLSCS